MGAEQGTPDTFLPKPLHNRHLLVSTVNFFGENETDWDHFRIVLLILQAGYIWHLFSTNSEWSTAAGNVGSHFILNNLFQFAFVLLWVHSRFWIAELMLILNFFNLTALYLRYSTTPRFVHIPVVSGPLAWTFVAILWDGAAMVGAHHLAARILANVVVWSIMVFGFLFLVAFKDYTMGLELTILSACKVLLRYCCRVSTDREL